MTMNGMMNSSTSTNQFLKPKVSEFCLSKIHSLFYFFTFSLFTFYSFTIPAHVLRRRYTTLRRWQTMRSCRR